MKKKWKLWWGKGMNEESCRMCGRTPKTKEHLKRVPLAFIGSWACARCSKLDKRLRDSKK